MHHDHKNEQCLKSQCIVDYVLKVFVCLQTYTFNAFYDIAPAPRMRQWKHHTQASKTGGKTCEWRKCFLFWPTIRRVDSREYFIVVGNSSKHKPQRQHHPPMGYERRYWPQEAWLMQGHPEVHRVIKWGTSGLPTSALSFPGSCISSFNKEDYRVQN